MNFFKEYNDNTMITLFWKHRRRFIKSKPIQVDVYTDTCQISFLTKHSPKIQTNMQRKENDPVTSSNTFITNLMHLSEN